MRLIFIGLRIVNFLGIVTKRLGAHGLINVPVGDGNA